MEQIRKTVERYWASATERDWTTFATTLSEDVSYLLPQTREAIRGRDTYVRFNAEYPGDWQVEVHRLLVDGDHATTWVRFAVGTEEMVGLSFFSFDSAGLISQITDFWPEPYDPPPGREHLVERY